jgi:excinuclease ABC subunit A
MEEISLRGARTHNLKNFDLTLPRNKLIVITGPSGSGKSSLAFDTLYAEGQRRYVESLSSYARQFLSMVDKPDIDHVEGLSPAISIEQKATSHNPRSTVGTVTEIHDYLRLLFARAGEPHCPTHHKPLKAQTISQMVDQIMQFDEGTKQMILAPVVKNRKGEHQHTFRELLSKGFIRARIDGIVTDLDDVPTLEKNKKHNIEVIIDRFKIKKGIEQRLAESLETALALTDGLATTESMDDNPNPVIFSSRYACPICGYALQELQPRNFSFNNPAGACSDCDGLGVKPFFDKLKIISNPMISLEAGAIRGWDKKSVYYYQLLNSVANAFNFDVKTPFESLDDEIQNIILYGSKGKNIEFNYVSPRGDIIKRSHPFEGIIPNIERRYRTSDSPSVKEELSKLMTTTVCQSCNGSRLKESSRNVYINKTNLPYITKLSIVESLEYFNELKLNGNQAQIAEKIIKEIQLRLRFLVNVGLDYLSLDRSADTLSGGEAQRIRLASQIGAGLVGVMYILDEPSIGLHQKDNDRLLSTLTHLRDLGNTVIVVEHDEDAMRIADHIVDIGPGAGIHGGKIVAQGTPNEIMKNKDSITGQYLSQVKKIEIPTNRTKPDKSRILEIYGATGNNLKGITLKLPIGIFTCVTGVSGSGKSTLINNTLYPLAASKLNKSESLSSMPYESINGLQYLDKVIDISQSPIGRTPRSNPATYTGLFTSIRELLSNTPEARARGYKPGRFSFNVKGGRCEACQGDGLIKVEMHFLPDVYVPCDQCNGKRYNRETLEIKYKGKNISEILCLTVEDAQTFFEAIPFISKKLDTLIDVGLGYIELGQSAITLSGGEAQRIKLAKELSKRATGRTLYILDEPTTGLHFEDIAQLLKVIQRLRDQGNTIVIIEHNLDVIKTADWIIDLGPNGGKNGGEIIAEGTPENICEVNKSYTGEYLKKYLNI